MESTTAFLRALLDTSFNNFITLRVLKVVYALMLVLTGLVSLAILIGAFASGDVGLTLAAFLLVPIGALVYVILVRITLETVALLFCIGRNTDKLASKK